MLNMYADSFSSSIMDPLSAEYNKTVELLKKELETQKSDQRDLKIQITRLIEENRIVTGELRESIQMRLDQAPAGSAVESLEHQLQAALECKNSVMEMWQVAIQEIEQQQQLLEGKRRDGNAELQEVEKRIFEVKTNYAKGLNMLSEELSETRNQLTNVKEELQCKTNKLEECKNLLQENEEKLKVKEELVSDISSENKEILAKIMSLESRLSDDQKIIDGNLNEIFEFKKKTTELLLVNTELKKKNVELQHQKSTSEKDAKESLLTAEEAILQKKEIAFKEQQALKRIQELKSSISHEVEHASLRYRNEIKNVKKQCDEKTQSLMKEIHALQLENSEKQSLFERALREKQALESKLESLCNENTEGGSVSNLVFDDMCKRLTFAERSRDEALLKTQSLEASIKDIQLNRDQEAHYLQTEYKNLKQQLQKLQKDLSETLIDRIQLSDQVTKLKKKLIDMEKELKLVKNKYQNELFIMQEALQQEQKTYQNQLHLTEEHYMKATTKLQYLLDSQLKISKKWKDTVQELTIKSEVKIRELCEDLVQLQNQNEEMARELHTNQSNVVQNVTSTLT